MQFGWEETVNQYKLSSPVLPQDPVCMSPRPCLTDAGLSALLTRLWPGQGIDLAGEEKPFLWAALVSSRSTCAGFQQDVSQLCSHGSCSTQGGGWQGTPLLTAACCFHDLTAASDQITLRIMASERTVLWGSSMHWQWNMSKEGTRGILASFYIKTVVNLSVPVLYDIAEVLCILCEYSFALLRFIMPYIGCWLCYNHTSSTALHQPQAEWGMGRVTTLLQLSPAIYRLFPGSCLEHQWHTTSSGPKNVSKCKNDTFQIQFTGTNF